MPYTIKEISQLTGLPASTLRYYDSQGLLPDLKRDNNNIRVFSDDDVRSIKLINCLKRSGLSIKDIKNFIDMLEQGDDALNERLEIFHKRRDILREELKNLQNVLDVIEYKCWFYEKACEAGSVSAVKKRKVPEKFRKAEESLHKII
ncbi:MAG: MerR family transcriptional regulator [Synergistaceae bacterium]|nr:MerR family transcriptional regulator [Synergistaceae bacterium]